MAENVAVAPSNSKDLGVEVEGCFHDGSMGRVVYLPGGFEWENYGK